MIIYIYVTINNRPIVPSPWNFHLHEAWAPVRSAPGVKMEASWRWKRWISRGLAMGPWGHGAIGALVTIAGWCHGYRCHKWITGGSQPHDLGKLQMKLDFVEEKKLIEMTWSWDHIWKPS